MDQPLRTTGFGNPAESYAESSIDWTALLFPKPHAMYTFKVTGRRLEELGINDGDIIIVDCSAKSIRPGKLGVFVSSGEFFIGRAGLSGGRIALDRGKDMIPFDADVRMIGLISSLIRFFS